MSVKDWRVIGIFGATLLAISVVNARIAWLLLAALAAIVVVANADKLAAILGGIQG